MLNIMEIENEIEYFRAWLKGYVKDRKVITGKDLAVRLGTSAQRISQFHSGRIDNGVRTFPRIPLEVRLAISEIANIPYEQILKEGKGIFNPEPAIPPEDVPAIVKKEIHRVLNEMKHQEKPSEPEPIKILYESLATQYVDEALKETGKKITPQQREKFIRITKEDMETSIKLTKVNIKKLMEIFEDVQ